MAGTDGQTSDSVTQRLAGRPFTFDFFRAVRLLESERRGYPRVGYSFSASQDAFRFCQNPSLAFAPSTVEALEQNPTDPVPKLFVRFFGLFGPNGPLPPHLTEYAHERKLNYGDPTIVAFANVFHHRLISFFYRAWAANQKALDLDRPNEQRFGPFVGSFFGMGMDSMANLDEAQDPAKLFFSGHLACPTGNAEGLASILAEYFEIPAEVETFVGRWMDLPADSRCRLGASPETGSLGVTAIVGSRYFECQMNFRIRLGPMKLADYLRLLPLPKPEGGAFRRLRQWVRTYCGEHFSWDVQFVLQKDQVPTTCLGQTGRLGWTTWLKTQPFTRDADELVLQPPETS